MDLFNLFYSVPPPDGTWKDGITNIAFTIGNIKIAWYGIFVFIGFFLAIIAGVLKLWKWYKVPIDPFYWFCLMGIPMAIFGARFWSCCLGDAKWPEFWHFTNGGLAIEGGVMFTALLGCWWFPFILSKPKNQIRTSLTKSGKPIVTRISMWVYFDAIIPCILLGQVMGRWGNYFNQELYGSVVNNENLAWFLHDCLPWMWINGNYYQPLFFYESMANLLFFIFIYFGFEFIPFRKCGDLGLLYFLWYGVLRLCLEPLRNHQYSFVLNYVTSALWVVFGVLLIILNQLVIYRFRNFNFFYFIKENISNFFISRFLRIKIYFYSKKTNKNKKNENKKNLKLKMYWLQSNMDKQKQDHIKNAKAYTKTENEIFYYRGK